MSRKDKKRQDVASGKNSGKDDMTSVGNKKSIFDNPRVIALLMCLISVELLLVVFNQFQINEISNALETGQYAQLKEYSDNIIKEPELSSLDISRLTSTVMTVISVFPELKEAQSEEDVMRIMMPSGVPEYSKALGGISFNDPVNSLNYLAKWYFVIKRDVQSNDPDAWQRYLRLAARPTGISCEFCCGVGPQGIDGSGNLRCGCQHNPALQAITLGLVKYTDYSDAEILREVMKWKTLFFPKSMISIGMSVAGRDASEVNNLAGMVGGC